MKKLILLPLLFAATLVNGQDAPEAEVKWISIEQAYKLSKTNPKKILVDVYTDWCGWCKRMDATTYSNPKIIRYINENYYAVKFDAEQKEEVTILDHTFKFVGEGRQGYHELAVALLQGKLSYPTTVFLDESFAIIQPVPGYLDAKGIEPILTYFASNKYKDTEWQEFEKVFESKL